MNSLLNNILDNFDSNTEKYKSITNQIKSYKFVSVDSHTDKNKILFYNENNELIYTSRYEIIGIYNSSNKIFKWSWAIYMFKKKSTSIMRNIWNYCTSLDKDEYTDSIDVKNEFIESSLQLQYQYQLDIHLAYASYISKIPFIYTLTIPLDEKYTEKNHNFSLLTDNAPTD